MDAVVRSCCVAAGVLVDDFRSAMLRLAIGFCSLAALGQGSGWVGGKGGRRS